MVGEGQSEQAAVAYLEEAAAVQLKESVMIQLDETMLAQSRPRCWKWWCTWRRPLPVAVKEATMTASLLLKALTEVVVVDDVMEAMAAVVMKAIQAYHF